MLVRGMAAQRTRSVRVLWALLLLGFCGEFEGLEEEGARVEDGCDAGRCEDVSGQVNGKHLIEGNSCRSSAAWERVKANGASWKETR